MQESAPIPATLPAAQSDAPAAGVRPVHIALLIAILIGGMFVRCHALGRTSYWFDELCSVLYARGESAAIFNWPQGYYDHAPVLASGPITRPWRDVWFGFDTTPPLYASVLRLWWQFFGSGDIAGRALSVTLSMLTLLVIFDVGRLIARPSFGLWAAAICAASPSIVRYAQEARAYALLGLISALLCDVTIRIVKQGPSVRRYLLIWLLAAAALWTHNFVAGGIAATALYGLISLRGRTRVIFVLVVMSAFVVELWELPVLLHHAANVHEGIDWTADPDPGLWFRTFQRFTVLPAAFLIMPLDGIVSSYEAMFSVAILLIPLLLERRMKGILLAALWPLGILGLVAVTDLWMGHGALQYTRYTLAAAPLVCVAFVGVAEAGGRWTRHLIPAIAVLGGLLAMPDAYSSQKIVKPEFRDLGQEVRSHLQPGDVLVVLSRPEMGMYAAHDIYLGVDYYAGPLPCAAAVIEGPIDDATRQRIWAHHHIWVIRCFDGFIPSGSVNPFEYLGPCTIKPVGDMRFLAGRLFQAERISP
jgi:hypothetical protein